MKTAKPPVKTRMIHTRITPDMHKRIRVRIAEEETTLQKWIVLLIEKELKK